MKKFIAYEEKPKSTVGEYGGIYLLGSRKDVDRLYQAMDVLVLPSRYEGLPVVAVEAQAAGLPCMLSNRITDEVKISENVSFLSIEAGSTQWAETVLRENNNRAKESKMSKFDIKHQAEKLVDYYISLLYSYA